MKELVTEQPKHHIGDTMDLYTDYSREHLPATGFTSCEGRCHRRCERGGTSPHRGCHGSRKRFLLMLFSVFLLFGVLVVWFCAYHSEGMSGFWDGATEILGGLAKRATGDPQNGNGVLIDRKYYLIIIFVGLFVVVILGIMLSAWCCKGAFSNPLCCPCYLCACCGGLACLECIGCGLCAAGLDEM